MQQPFPLVPEGDSSGLEVRSQSSSAAGVGVGAGGPNTALFRPLMALALRWLASSLLATSLPSQGDRTAAPPRLSLLQSPHRSVECPPEWPPHQARQRAPRSRRVAS